MGQVVAFLEQEKLHGIFEYNREDARRESEYVSDCVTERMENGL